MIVWSNIRLVQSHNLLSPSLATSRLTEVPENEAGQVEEDTGNVERSHLVTVLDLHRAESLQYHGHHHDPVQSLKDHRVGDDEVDGQEGEAVGEEEHGHGPAGGSWLLSHLTGR